MPIYPCHGEGCHLQLHDDAQEIYWGWDNFYATMGKTNPTILDRENVRCLDCYANDIRAGRAPAGYVRPGPEPAESDGSDGLQ